MATGDLNEYKIHELLAARLPIDVLGVGTELSTSADKPSLGVVYKMVEMEGKEGKRFTVKLSEDKATIAGAKQIFRFSDHDVLARSSECIACGCDAEVPEALLRPVMIGGRLLEPLPSASRSAAPRGGIAGSPARAMP